MTQEPKPPTPESSTSKLLEYKQAGYLFHGSYVPDIQMLEPRQAADSGENPNAFNIDNAVFASPDVASTVAFALFKGWESRPDIPDDLKRNGWRIDWTDEGPIAQVTKLWEPIVENLSGYVYIIPSNTFNERAGGQMKSKVSVTPLDKVKVTIKD